jgi:homocysteine S-methyltransferase
MTSRYRGALPQLAGGGSLRFLTDAGIETDLIHHHGVDLPEFATFPLLDIPHGRSLLVDYVSSYGRLALGSGYGFILDTVTWRASERWGAALGYDAQRLEAVNRDAVDLAVAMRHELEPAEEPIVIDGVIGPRFDGYQEQNATPARSTCSRTPTSTC